MAALALAVRRIFPKSRRIGALGLEISLLLSLTSSNAVANESPVKIENLTCAQIILLPQDPSAPLHPAYSYCMGILYLQPEDGLLEYLGEQAGNEPFRQQSALDEAEHIFQCEAGLGSDVGIGRGANQRAIDKRININVS